MIFGVIKRYFTVSLPKLKALEDIKKIKAVKLDTNSINPLLEDNIPNWIYVFNSQNSFFKYVI